MPTVVFEAKDAAGAIVFAVKVKMDGDLLAERLQGSALPIDPGEHTFTFEVAGRPSVEKHLMIFEGEKLTTRARGVRGDRGAEPRARHRRSRSSNRRPWNRRIRRRSPRSASAGLQRSRSAASAWSRLVWVLHTASSPCPDEITPARFARPTATT